MLRGVDFWICVFYFIFLFYVCFVCLLSFLLTFACHLRLAEMQLSGFECEMYIYANETTSDLLLPDGTYKCCYQDLGLTNHTELYT